ncbi:MBOAT family O-acyltransferase [Pseudomonas sp. NPDC007930]|uniref:MBOAT family O-acyltransferase n=1 Tax=Pseudomonas sp. NPDC007930 TaxID=3364417 RepID=UPI0036F124C5
MNVPSFEFLGFAAVAALLFNLVRRVGYRQVVLLATNLVFFASLMHGWVACVPFLAFLLLGYGLLRACQARAGQSQRGLLAGAVVLIILVFAWLKKYGFFPPGVFLDFPYATVGLSYVFFRVLHLVIDAGGGVLPAITPLGYINYTLNFTALISGPIQRYADYKTQADSVARPDVINAGRAIERICIGFFKVFLLSHLLHDLQGSALGLLPEALGLWSTVLAGVLVAASYPLFLYCNFSGYTDVVIGVGYFFGLRLPENFNNPFIAENFISFWGRWHMSLSNWLKTYVYNTLLMRLMERFPARGIEPFLGVLAFFVTFFLVGIWHGQTSEFVMFGLLQGGGVALNKLYQIQMAQRLGKKQYKALCARPLYTAACRGLTFAWFAFTLFWFWASWAQIEAFYSALGWAGAVLVWAVVWLGAALLIEAVRRLWAGLLLLKAGDAPLATSRYTRTVSMTLVAALTTVFILLASSPAPDIVYKTF